MSNYRKAVGNRIRAARKRAGFKNQDLLATHLNTDQSRISRWETGEDLPEPEMRPLLATALKVSVAHLFDVSDVDGPRPPQDLTEAYKEINSLIGGLGPDDIRLALNALRDIARTPDKITPPTINKDETSRPVRRR